MNWFVEARYGLFVHYGLYSLLGRGEWAWNREAIPDKEYISLKRRFDAAEFDANAICRLAVDAGMRYIVFTTMHHEGFRLYPSKLGNFDISNSAAAGRDLVQELVEAARAHGLRIGLYHSLNNWHDRPDAVDALEDPGLTRVFVDRVHERIRELVERYRPVDVLWYDGWWPFDAEGWQAQRMNTMVRSIQPQILFNGRNGLPGDFATPEQHLTAPQPWRPWEACLTLNESWGFHSGDQEWKTPSQVLDLLTRCAQGRGNLLMNVGLTGSGLVPPVAADVLKTVGRWLRVHGEAIFDTEPFSFGLREKGSHRGDWNLHGPLTLRGNTLYWHLRRVPPGNTATLGGLEATVGSVARLDTGEQLPFVQDGGRLTIGLVPGESTAGLWPVLKIVCATPPSLYQCGGLRVPRVQHCHYDPCPSDIQH